MNESWGRSVAAWALLAVVMGGGGAAAQAQIDAGGRWFVSTEPDFVIFSCQLDLTQNGTELSGSAVCGIASASLSGSIDPTTGELHISGPDSEPFALCGTIAYDATVAADSRTFSGTFTCSALGFTFPVVGSRCGNGVLDTDEQCDDSNRFTGDCCDAQCRFEAAGTTCNAGQCTASTCDGAGSCDRVEISGPCDDFNPCTADDACVGGECVGSVLPDGTPCDDANACTVGETCQFGGFCFSSESPCDLCSFCLPDEGCVAFPEFYSCKGPVEPEARLRLTQGKTDAGDAVSWTWSAGAATDVLEFGDPRVDTDYALCVYDAGGSGPFGTRVLASTQVEAGSACGDQSCWTATPSGYEYADKQGGAGAVRSLLLEGGADGEARIVVKAKGSDLGLRSLPASLPVQVQLRASNGACWAADYPEVARNNARELRGVGGAPAGAE